MILSGDSNKRNTTILSINCLGNDLYSNITFCQILLNAGKYEKNDSCFASLSPLFSERDNNENIMYFPQNKYAPDY